MIVQKKEEKKPPVDETVEAPDRALVGGGGCELLVTKAGPVELRDGVHHMEELGDVEFHWDDVATVCRLGVTGDRFVAVAAAGQRPVALAGVVGKVDAGARGVEEPGPLGPSDGGLLEVRLHPACGVGVRGAADQWVVHREPYACSMCPVRFARKSAIAPHERTHTGEKPYACSMCPVRFTNKSAIAPHERTHTGEKPYACSMCPRRFTNKSAVARHERTHTGEKPTHA